MKLNYLITLIISFKILSISAQTIDSTFNGPLPIRPAKVSSMRMLSNGKILISGDITHFNSKPVNNLILLNSDSTIDENFEFKGRNGLLIKKLEIQKSGYIIGLAYENSNYSLFKMDTLGNIIKEINTLTEPSYIAIQNDDKVLVSGGLYYTNGYLLRYNSDLTIDTTFNNISFNQRVSSILVDDNKIFVSGLFSLVNDTLANDIVKLNLNGTIDTSFNTGIGTDDEIGSMTLQPNGKILIGKAYINSFNGVPCFGMIRLNTDGSLDEEFNPISLNGKFSDLTLKDSSIYVAASTYINSVFGTFLLKLKSDGSLDNGFNPIKLDVFGFEDFNIIFSGNNIVFNNSSASGNKYGVSMCDSIGNIINEFAPKISRYGIISLGNYYQEKLLIAGDFIEINGFETYGIAQLNKDGSVDTSYSLTTNYGKVIQLEIIDGNSILVSTGSSFFKLDSKGQMHPDFNFTFFKTLAQVTKFIVLPNGRIMVGDCNGIYRLNANGTIDTTFNMGMGITGGSVSTAFDFDMQNDKVIYGSMFTQFNGVDVNQLVRLNSDGSVDTTLDIGDGPDGGIFLIKVLNSKEFIVGGNINKFNGLNIPFGLVKLSENGTIDTVFNNNQKNSYYTQLVYAKAVQLDSTIFIKSFFNTITALKLNGLNVDNFNIPFSITNLNDIIAIKDTIDVSTSKKNDSTENIGSFIYTIGAFKRYDNPTFSFIEKLAINRQTPPATLFSVSTNKLILEPFANSSKTFDITSNINWTIKKNQEWLTLNTQEGSGNSTITLSATENPNNETRTDTLEISGTGASVQKVVVTQDANATGINEPIYVDISIFPNPGNTTLFINNITQNSTIVIIDLQGKTIKKQTMINNQIDISELSNGIYIMQIHIGDNIVTRKFVKNNNR